MLKEGQNLNFAGPAADIRALMNSPAARLPFPGVAEAASLVSGQVPPGPSANSQPSPREFYVRAYEHFVVGQYDLAMQGFKDYIARYPQTDFTDNTQYWI